MMRMDCFMRAKVLLMLKQQKIFFDFLRFCIGSEKDIHASFEGGGLEETISNRPEAGFAR